ncbi:MAG: hypothetical protein WBD79_10740, partial [Anaerolineae bacterium]
QHAPNGWLIKALLRNRELTLNTQKETLMKIAIRRLTLWLIIGILILPGCSQRATPNPTPASTPTLTIPPLTSTPTPIPDTPTPAPPTPTPTPALPDAKTNPLGALEYAETTALFRTATFTMTTTARVEIEETTAQALGADATELLEQALNNIFAQLIGKVEGAVEVVDAESNTSNYSSRMEGGFGDQSAVVDMVFISGTLWAGVDGRWEVFGPGSAGNAGASNNPVTRLSDEAVDAAWVEDLTIGGEALRRIHVDIDPKRSFLGKSLLESVTAASDLSPEQRDALIEEMSVGADVWLIADTLRVRQESYHLEVLAPLPSAEDLGVKDGQWRMIMDQIVRFDNFDRPVDIKPPLMNAPIPSLTISPPTPTAEATPSIGSTPVGSGAGSAYKYVPVRDYSGALLVEVPAEWDQVESEPVTDDSDKPIGVMLVAAPTGAEDGPLVVIAAFANDSDQFDADAILDTSDTKELCQKYEGRQDYADDVHTGRLDRYSQCGVHEGVMFAAAFAPKDRGYFVTIYVLALTDADVEAADHIFKTFRVVGTLPGMPNK